jgi:hypothetical protein
MPTANVVVATITRSVLGAAQNCSSVTRRSLAVEVGVVECHPRPPGNPEGIQTRPMSHRWATQRYPPSPPRAPTRASQVARDADRLAFLSRENNQLLPLSRQTAEQGGRAREHGRSQGGVDRLRDAGFPNSLTQRLPVAFDEPPECDRPVCVRVPERLLPEEQLLPGQR